MPVRSNPLTPAYRWNPDLRGGRYIGADGRIVSGRAVRGALDATIARGNANIQDLANALRGGRISLADWQSRMAAEIKQIHLASAAAARGGWSQMSKADYGRVGGRLWRQYAYLNNFAQQIADGTQRLDGTFVRRAMMYGEAGRGTYHRAEGAMLTAAGYDEERNELGQAEHCAGCLDETAREWVPIGDLRPVGDRDCLTHCKCHIRYRISRTGAER